LAPASNGIVDRQQYAIQVTAVIAGAVLPTLIAQRWLQPFPRPVDGD